MTDYIDVFNTYVMGSAQILTGFYFFTKFLQAKVRFSFYLIFSIVCLAMIKVIPSGSLMEFFVYVLLLIVSGIFVCHADWMASILYAALTVEIMQISFDIVDSLLTILYPFFSSFHQGAVGIVFSVLGNMALLLAALCYHMAYRYFCDYETENKRYVLMILTPVFMIFCIGEYISSTVYGNVIVTDENGLLYMEDAKHYQILAIRLLALASLFCVMAAYKKILQNFRLSMELSLLEQEEHSLNQYVEETRERYEKTKSFRHDIKNHMMIVKELLQNGKPQQALQYIGDLEDMTKELSFPYCTNNPVADILLGNKLGRAKRMGIDVHCSLALPVHCFVRDIDFGIILSNALDNAVCACKKMEGSADRYIQVTGRIQGDFLLLEIENSFRGNGLSGRGTGLSNIERVAKKYHGAMQVKTQGNVFTLSVLLIIPQHPERIPQQFGSYDAPDSRKS